MELLIKNCNLNNESKDILIRNGLIEKIANDIQLDGIRTIEADGKSCVPAFYNTHTHAAMTLLRGYADDIPLIPWLETKIWPAEKKLTEEDIYIGTKLACIEMIKSGTLFFNDMYWHPEAAAQAIKEMGIRAAIAGSFMGKSENFDEITNRIKSQHRAIESFDSKISFTLGPHSIYTVSERLLKWAAEYSAENGIIIHTHLSEIQDEYTNCLKLKGMKPVFYLDKLGALTEKTVIAHAVWLDDDEIELLAQRGASVSYNPVSNMKLAVGRAMNYRKMKEAGVNVTFGTDGCSSNNNLDMFDSMKIGALLQKFAYNDTCLMTAEETLKCATENGAKLFSIDSGKIEEGKIADLLLLRKNYIGNQPGFNTISDMVYSMSGDCVDTTICAGNPVMENSTIAGEEQIIEATEGIKRKLLG